MNKRKLIYRLHRIINHIPFNNSKKGPIQVEDNGAILINCSIRSKGYNNRIILAEGGVLKNCSIAINGNNNTIELARYISCNSVEFHIEDDGNVISIGEKSNLCGKCHIAATEGTKIEIGSYCLLSSDIFLRSGDSHSIVNMDGARINYAEDILIGDHVWIGYGVKINKGTVIHNDCVVGTGAIVAQKFEDGNCIIAGVPGKIVKRNINWDIKRFV